MWSFDGCTHQCLNTYWKLLREEWYHWWFYFPAISSPVNFHFSSLLEIRCFVSQMRIKWFFWKDTVVVHRKQETIKPGTLVLRVCLQSLVCCHLPTLMQILREQSWLTWYGSGKPLIWTACLWINVASGYSYLHIDWL